MLVFFNLYHDCYFELGLVSLGKITTKTASASSLVKTVGLEVWEYYNNRGMWVTLDELTDLSNAKKTSIGNNG